MNQTIIEISIRQSYIRISVGARDESAWQWSSITLERDGWIREGVYGEGIDTLSIDSLAILRGILQDACGILPHPVRIREHLLADDDSPLTQSLLVLCDSIRESVADSRIIEVLDAIQSARLASV